jgi:hypothetical protein
MLEVTVALALRSSFMLALGVNGFGFGVEPGPDFPIAAATRFAP